MQKYMVLGAFSKRKYRSNFGTKVRSYILLVLTRLFRECPTNLGRTLSGKHVTPGRADHAAGKTCLRAISLISDSKIVHDQVLLLCRSQRM